MTNGDWPPQFTIDQERILNLLTGDRFYSDPSATLREAVLNSIDAVNRRAANEANFARNISVLFNNDNLSFTVSDNGVGMNRNDVANLFSKIGASAANAEALKKSVGEFGIGVISYFMAGDSFSIETYDGESEAVALAFSRDMLAGGPAEQLPAARTDRGTTLSIRLRDQNVFDLLIEKFPYWCRDVDGLVGEILPSHKRLQQGGTNRDLAHISVTTPDWVERSHLSPVADLTGWNSMSGRSVVDVLYRGVFVQEFTVQKFWGIQGSIDVDPKHFKPRLNREGFIGGQFGQEVEAFLRDIHPTVLEAMAQKVADAVERGALNKWDANRWASFWLSVPRDERYASAVKLFDSIFRKLPAFQLAVAKGWEPVSLAELIALSGDIYVAPNNNPTEEVSAAIRLLRNTGAHVIRGIERDRQWMRYATRAFGTTADLIVSVFSDELPPLKPIQDSASQILNSVGRKATLFTGPPAVDLVGFGSESPPALRLGEKLVINVDNSAGAAIVRDAIDENTGPSSLVGITARHSHEHLGQVAAAVRSASGPPELLSPVRRRYIRNLLP